MKHLNQVAGFVTAVLIGTLVMQGAAYAQIASDPNTNARHSRVVGLWEVEVSVENCTTGAPIASFLALHKYELGGTGQIVPSTNPTRLSAHMMVWSHVGGDDYVMAAKMYRYDAAGSHIGSLVLTNEISIDEDADEYVGSGVAEVYDLAGNLVATSCPSISGSRFTGE